MKENAVKTEFDEATAVRCSLRDMLINLLTSPIALDRSLAVEFVQRLLIAHGWCIREVTATMVKEQYENPATPPPADYMSFLHDLARRERNEAVHIVSGISKDINAAMGINPMSKLN